MKKIIILLAIVVGIIIITSCNNEKGDVLKGTWVGMVNTSSTMAEEVDMRYIFDGKGHYLYISSSTGMPERRSAGTYVLEGNIVYTYYTIQNQEGETIEKSQVLNLDLTANPPSLSAPVYDAEGRYLHDLVFYKQ